MIYFHVDGILKKLIRIPVSDKDHAWKIESPVSLTEKKKKHPYQGSKKLESQLSSNKLLIVQLRFFPF